MKQFLSTFTVIFTLVAITISSCKKEEPDTETQSAMDNNISETEFTNIMPTVNNLAIKENGIKSMRDDGTRGARPTITVDPADTLNGFPVTMIIDYGTIGIVDSIDGKTRKGIIRCLFSEKWRNVGAYAKITLENYSVNGILYTADSIKLTHSALYGFTHQIFKGKCTAPNFTIHWEGTRVLTHTSGYGDLDPYNDVFSLSGNASGITRGGKSYTVNITVPIVKRTSCSWAESGRLDLTPSGLDTRTVDFGNGVCDNIATLIIKGNSFNFTMN